MAQYSSTYSGKVGVVKTDIIRIVMGYGGDMDDARVVMVECIKKIAQHLLPD